MTPRRPDPTTHPTVRAVVDAYLSLVDAEAPGLVEGLYLTGSVALHDFRPGASDIDFVAVTAARPDGAAVDALRRVHARLRARHRRPFFDGPYLTWRDLAAEPRLAEPGPHAHGGGFSGSTAAERQPVTWHMVAEHGVPVRGPQPAGIAVHTDRAGLRAWVRDNLDSYWLRWRRRATRPLSRTGLASLAPVGPVWAVLGVSRLHHTLATGRIISKTAAGEYARRRFDPRWHPVIDEALRIRRGGAGPGAYRSPLRRRRDTLAFIDHVVDDAHRAF